MRHDSSRGRTDRRRWECLLPEDRQRWMKKGCAQRSQRWWHAVPVMSLKVAGVSDLD